MRDIDQATFDALLTDAASRLGCDADGLTAERFVQSFSSTGCGFPGIAGQMFTDAPVAIFVSPSGGACVYVGNRLAYCIAKTNDRFKDDIARSQMIYAANYTGQYDEVEVAEPAQFVVRGSKRGARRGPHALSRAIDEAWMIAKYGLKGGIARTAEVLIDGTDTVVARLHPQSTEGEGPVIEHLDAIKPHLDSTRFPHISAKD